MIAVADRRLLLPPNIAVPFTPPIVLARSAAAIATPADITEDTLVTISVPAGAMGANGILRILTIWSFINNANSKTQRARFSGGAGTQFLTRAYTTDVSNTAEVYIANRGATNSQVGTNKAQTSAGGAQMGGVITSAVDTTAATTIVLTGQKAVAGDVLTLESYLVELFYGA